MDTVAVRETLGGVVLPNLASYGYVHGGEHPHHPTLAPLLTCEQMNNCATVGGLWHASVIGMWTKNVAGGNNNTDTADAVADGLGGLDSKSGQGSGDGGGGGGGGTVVLQLQLPAALSAAGYGAPPTLFLTVEELPAADGMLAMELVWAGKPPARLYESIYFDMHPVLKPVAQFSFDPSHTVEIDSDGPTSANNGSGWKLLIDKIGTQVDAADVVKDGGSAVHGMDPSGGLTFASPPLSGAALATTLSRQHPSLRVDSVDAGLVVRTRVLAHQHVVARSCSLSCF
jgi:hypothetical protein